jgi:hypothetical protein
MRCMNKARVFIANRLGDEMKYASNTKLGTTIFMNLDICEAHDVRTPSHLPNFHPLIRLLLHLYYTLFFRPLSLPFVAPSTTICKFIQTCRKSASSRNPVDSLYMVRVSSPTFPVKQVSKLCKAEMRGWRSMQTVEQKSLRRIL